MELTFDPNVDATAASVCAFVADIQSKIGDIEDLTTWLRCREAIDNLKICIRQLPLPVDKLSARSKSLLELSGTTLWNTALRLSASQGDSPNEDFHRVCAQVYVLAFLMMESCLRIEGDDNTSNAVRSLQVAIKCAEICLEAGVHDRAADVIEQCSAKSRILELSEQTGEVRALAARYHLMRCHLLVQRGELGLAEQMLSKVPEPLVERDTSIAEIYADTCHQLLRGALRKTQKSQAVSCICRIRGVLRILHSEDESNGHRWLDLSILRTLVTANFSNFDEEVQALAMDVCDMIQQKHPEEPPVVVLQLELATRQSNPEPRELYEALQTHIQVSNSTVQDLKRSMHYAVKLFDLSPNLSLDCLKQLFSKMSMDSSKKDFLEQTFVTVARLLSSPSLHSPDFLDFLCGIANRMVEESRLMLSTVVSEAVLIILWRKIELLFSQGNFSSAQRWCCFTQHPVFQHSGCVNRLKVLRKSALCAIHTGDVQPVWNMWEKARNDVELDGETIYVMYRLTLASSKAVPGIGLGFAKECLRLLLGGESSRWNYFLACISAAQTAGRDGVLLDHLYQLSIDETALKSTRQLEYFRITISITTKEARKGLREGKDGCELMDMLCDLFDRASRISSNDINELEWFSRNSYRFALEICESRLVNYAMRLFRMSARFLGLFSSHLGTDAIRDMADRLRSIVYAANLLIEYTERNTTFDAGARVQYRNWTSDLRGDLDRLEKDYSLQNAGDNSIRIARERTLHFLRLERAILCGRWDEVRKLTQSLHECRDLNLNRYLADLVLSSDMPPDMAMGCMRRIVKSLIKESDTRDEKMQHLRCLFHLAIERGSSAAIAEHLLDKALLFAGSADNIESGDSGLAWFSSRAFNHAVDLYLSSQLIDAQRWAKKAMDLARLMGPSGVPLVQELRSKYEKWLTFERA